MTTRYRLDAAQSQFTVQAFAGGLLSFMAHSPLFLVRKFEGEFAGEPGANEGARFSLTVQAESLEVANTAKPADQAEIEQRMRREVLEVDRYPEIRFDSGPIEASSIDAGRLQLRMPGILVLHGVSNRHQQIAEARVYADGIRLAGESELHLSDFGIRPVTALAGAVRLKDSLQIRFDLGAWREK